MRFGYWMPIFGGWLRNVSDEGMSIAWPYIKDLAIESEQHGFELSLIAELNLNDIKGHRAPSLDCWALAPAVAAVTSTLELMLAVRPNYHSPALTAKALSTLDVIAPGRISLNVVSSWWKDEATQYGAPFDVHDARYARTSEWLDIVGRLLREDSVSHSGELYQIDGTILEPKPTRPPVVYMGGESPRAKEIISAQSDAYVMHGDAPERIAEKVRRAVRAAGGGREAAAAVRRVRLRDLPGHRGRGPGRAGPDPERAGPRPRRTRPTRTSSPGRSWSPRCRWRSTACRTGGCAAG